MKTFFFVILWLVIFAGSFYLSNLFWITKPQVQNGFTAVGKMLDDLDARVKVLEQKK